MTTDCKEKKCSDCGFYICIEKFGRKRGKPTPNCRKCLAQNKKFKRHGKMEQLKAYRKDLYAIAEWHERNDNFLGDTPCKGCGFNFDCKICEDVWPLGWVKNNTEMRYPYLDEKKCSYYITGNDDKKDEELLYKLNCELNGDKRKFKWTKEFTNFDRYWNDSPVEIIHLIEGESLIEHLKAKQLARDNNLNV